MSAATKMSWNVKFTPVAKGRKTLGVYQEEPVVEKGRIPRVSRLMALAIKFEGMIRDGVVMQAAGAHSECGSASPKSRIAQRANTRRPWSPVRWMVVPGRKKGVY